MVRTVLVTGSASGIGAATARQLRHADHRVIGADVHNAEIVVDLGSPQGRAQLLAQVERLAPDGLDGIVTCAGVGGVDHPELIVSVNYFGTVAIIEGLRPMMLRAEKPRVVAIVSSASILPYSSNTMAACLTGNEAAARVAARCDPNTAYTSSKYALARWLRRTSTHADWAGSGILLNGINPGTVNTPMTAGMRASADGRAMLEHVTPIAVTDYCEPEVIAEAACFLATLDGSYLVGQLLFVDGGTDAIMRPETI